MKGRIGVESEPGYGSTFTVHIPAQVTAETAGLLPAEGSTDASDAIADMQADRDTILVIDDDAAVRELMSRFLMKLGFNVLTVASGKEGLRLAKQVRPVLITLDVVMPEADGWSILSKLKADSELSKVPVIMVTIVDNEAKGLDLGASNYLIKPVDRERLAILIEKHRITRFTNITPSSAVPTSRLSHGQKHGELEAELSERG
jgi:DNA-binding response OmpR family regulator